MRFYRPGSLLVLAMALGSACAGGGHGDTGSGGSIGGGGSRDVHESARGGSSGFGGTIGSGGSSAMGGAGSGGSAGSSAGGTAWGGSSSGGALASGGGTTVGGSMASGGSKSDVGGAATGGAGPGSGGRGGSEGTAPGTGGSAHTGKWRIMLLGDSITETTCYPKLLSQELISKGHTNFELVGTSLNNQSCGTAPNVQTEGHSCYLVSNLVKDVTTVAGCGGTKGSLAELKSWAAEKPEVVIMQYGTNDAWSSIPTQSILDAYTAVIGQFRAQKPDVIFFVAQITPLNPGGCDSCEANVEALNAKIPGWASGQSTATSPITVVNVWSSLPAAAYTPNSSNTNDGCHPNPAGSQLMADKWYESLTARGIP